MTNALSVSWMLNGGLLWESGLQEAFLTERSKFKITLIYLFISDKPKLLSVTPGNTTVTEFEDVSLGAVVEGNPAPYVAWVSQNGSVLQNETDGFNYTITRITREQKGAYKCVATNPVNKDSKDFVINVKCKFAHYAANLNPVRCGGLKKTFPCDCVFLICWQEYRNQ